MTPDPTLIEQELLPCRACGSPCRVERFEGGPIEGVLTVYFCANSTKFGGDCPDPHAYLNVNAWNAQGSAALPSEAMRTAVQEAVWFLRAQGGHEFATALADAFNAMRATTPTAPVQDDDAEFVRGIAKMLTGGIDQSRVDRLYNIASRLSPTGLVEALRKCRARFYEYADSHHAKGTEEGDTKAARNIEMAEMCSAALSNVLPDEV